MTGIPIIRGERRKVLIRRVAALLAFCLPLSAQSLDAVLGRIDKSAPQFKSLAADVKRDVHTAIVNDDTMETGTIKVKREKGTELALFDFKGADEKTVAFDGKTVSILYPRIKTVQIYNVGDNRAVLDQYLLLGFGITGAEMKSGYEVSWKGVENVNGQPADHLQLVPRSADVLKRLKRADLWIPAGSGVPVQQQFFTSASGDFMTMTYMNMKANAAVSDDQFKLKIPKGAKVEHPTL